MPFIYEQDSQISLHFEISSIQSAMLKDTPEQLVLGYTQTMMGFLLFQPDPQSIAMIGLGGGSLAKYCAKYLPDVDFTAVELNPKVIDLRDRFNIPQDSSKFRVLCANGVDYVSNQAEKLDVLLLDGFDIYGQPRELCSTEFYRNCFEKLNDGGVMVANIVSDDVNCSVYLTRIFNCFEDKVVVVDEKDSGNKIVFACKGAEFPPSPALIMQTAKVLGSMHSAPMYKTAQKITHSMNKQAMETQAYRRVSI